MTSSVPHVTTSLADLLPGVRYADPQALADQLDDERLPLGWWHATPLVEAERLLGTESLVRSIAETLRALWPHLELGDALPVLRLLDTGTGRPGLIVGEVTEETLAALLGGVLDRLNGRRRVEERVRDAAGVVACWLAEDAPPEAWEALALLRRLACGEDDDTPSPTLPAPREPEVPAAEEPAAAEPTPAEPEPAVPAPSEPAPAEPDTSPIVTTPHTPTAPAHLLDEPFAAFVRLAATWDERERAIAGLRLFAKEPETLGDLGDRFSVSRERVRQIERTILDAVARWLAYDEHGRAFAGHLAAVAELLGAVARVDEVRALHADHGRTVDALGVPLGDVVARLLPERAVDGGWVVRGDIETLKSVMGDELLAACGDGPLPWEDAVALAGRHGVRGEVLAGWVAEVGRFRAMDGHLLYWGRSVNDRAAAVLALHGKPLSMEEIHERLADGTAINSMRNQVWTDERFIRLDRNLYGLRAWGGEEYLGIREMITREIQAAGGEAEVTAVVDAISGRFDVAAASVRTNLGAPEFRRVRRGWIALAEESAEPSVPYEPRRDVAATRRCFVGADRRWWYRLEVTAEHLRGSGTPVPNGWAAHIGGAPACEPIPLRHDAGESVLQWSAQPVLGSIRPLLEHIGAGLGDQVFLNVTDGRLSALRLPEPPPGAGPATRAARLTGWTADVTAEDAVEAIARRIGADFGPGAADLLERLEDRRDKDIAELLREALAETDAPV
ncbi:sigma factor-like helix-turn-helix DNA-binding protein [Streptomyces sp. NPDC048629]|uniref:sigma factor-like helix-turn-helix DNA-binding protein n=1 Tax=Streptomyces sp. NPDC048629 TaxID=3154824 RepID=UPI003435E0B0